jgi:hypothetical protein
MPVKHEFLEEEIKEDWKQQGCVSTICSRLYSMGEGKERRKIAFILSTDR